MMAATADHDVAVIGASIAGCTAATLLARSGARVALIERRPDPAAFKRICGHYLQPGAAPVLAELGVLDELRALGAHEGRPELWSRAGWVRAREDTMPQGSLSVRREVLDPVLRRAAAATPGVELLLGETVDGLRREGAVTRVRLRGGRELSARLVVAADGRGSKTAELAGLSTKTSENLRFGYAGYFEGPPLRSGIGVQLWYLEPDVALVTPTDGGLNLYVAMPHRDRIPEFRRDPERALRDMYARLPDTAPLAQSRRVGPMIGKLDLTNEARPAIADGIALVGDAALTSDPVAAIGCGWALESASWLAQSVAPWVAGEEPLDRGLKRYRACHRRGFGQHSFLLAEFARREALPPVQRLLLAAAIHDRRVAERLHMIGGRTARPTEALTPAVLARAAAVAARHRRPRAAHPRPAPTPAGSVGS